MRAGEQAPPPPGLTALHPLGEKETISCGNPFDWKFERAAALSRSPGGVLAWILFPDETVAEIPTRTVFFSVRF